MIENAPSRRMARLQNIVGTLITVFLLSWLAPILVIAGPMLARSYVHVWKVVLGLEPDCMYPALDYQWGKPDCRAAADNAKRGDRLPAIPPSP
ncbi:hypothetical protein [Hyphomicrobium sp. DY-1]|uniref:hypothetical protein n=1 Tax=Hyphomicrobium sp. DY-1 TaxID=3075650 RepID=UPI0039C1CEEB